MTVQGKRIADEAIRTTLDCSPHANSHFTGWPLIRRRPRLILSCETERGPCRDQERVMPDTMHLLAAASGNVPLRHQDSRSARVTGRETVMKPPASIAFARRATALALALTVLAGIAAAPRSATSGETWKASRQTSVVAAPPSAMLVAGRQRIAVQPTGRRTVDPDPSTRFVEKLYKELMHWPAP
jgi:hypothetical protein